MSCKAALAAVRPGATCADLYAAMLDAAGNAALLRDVNNGPAHGLADGLAGGSDVPDSDLPGHVPSAVATGDGHRRGAPVSGGGRR